MANTLGSVLVKFGVDLAEFDKGVKKVESSVEGLSSNFKKLGTAIGASMAAVGASVAAGLGVSVKKAADFEQSLADIQAVSGLTAKEMDQVKKMALKMGADTKYSATEAAKGMEELIKAGVSVKDIMSGGLKGALDLATAGELDLAQAAEIASTALNAFKRDNLTVTDAANILAGAANASATSVGELKFGLSAVASVASGVGLSFNDTATTLALFAQNGLKGSDAGTSLKTMLMNLQPQTKGQIELFNKLGLTLKDGSNIFFDANGHMKSMSEISGILHDKLKDMTDQQRLATLETLFGADAIRAGNILYQEGAEGIKKMNDEMKKVTAAEVAAKKMGTFWGAVENMNGAIETLTILVGEPLLGPLTNLTKKIDEVVSSFAQDIQNKGLIPALKDMIPPDVLQKGKELMDFVTGLRDQIEAQDWQAVGNTLGTALHDILVGIGNFGKQIADFITDQMSSIDWSEVGKKAFVGTVGFIVGFVSALLDPIAWLEVIKEYWDDLLIIVLSFMFAPAKLLAPIAKTLSKVPLAGKFLEWIVNALNNIGAPIREFMSRIAGDMGSFFMDGFGKSFSKYSGSLLGGLKSVWDRVITAIKDFGTTIYVHAGDWMIKMGSAIGNGAGTVTKFFRTLWNDISLILGEMAHKAIDFGKYLVEGLWKGISNSASWLLDKVRGWAGSVADAVKNFFDIRSPSKLMAEFGRYIAEGLAQGMKDNTDKTKSSAEILAQSISVAVSKMSGEISIAAEIAKANFDLLRLKMGENADQSKLLAAELQSMQAELQASSDHIVVLTDAYNRMKSVKGETALETQKLLLELTKEQVAYEELAKSIEKAKKAQASTGELIFDGDSVYKRNANGDLVQVATRGVDKTRDRDSGKYSGGWYPDENRKDYVGGFKDMPRYAKGTNYHPGGPALIGEEGPEVLDLHRGASVTPLDKLDGGGVTLHVDARGATFLNDRDIDRFAQLLTDRIRLKTGLRYT